MAITGISRLRDCGIFRDFRWPDNLPAFGRYNLIYGWNGSGKTTLSRLFRGMEMGRAPASGQVSFSINGEDISGDRFAHATLPIRVFNRDFVTESIFPTGGGDVPPIFVVGKDSVEKQKEVEQLRNCLDEARAVLKRHQSRSQDVSRALDQHCIDAARTIKETLRSHGANPYSDYDKRHFQRRAERMVADGDPEACRLGEAEQDRLLAQARAGQRTQIPELTYQLPDFDRLVAATSELLSTTVVSSTIQSLEHDVTLSEWLHQGLALHRDRHAERCLFCEQALPKDRLARLAAHFNTEYEQLLRRLRLQMTYVAEASSVADRLDVPPRAEVYDHLGEEYEEAKNSLLTARDSTKQFLDSLLQALVNKQDHAFERLTLGVSAPAVGSDVVERVNRVIRRHSQACDGLEQPVSEARTRLEAHLVADRLEDFVRLRDAVRESDASMNEAAAEVERLSREIERLEPEVIEHRQPAEQLNEDLHKYLGHEELRLETKDTGYAVTRNGVTAYALSEGETTAIALLYFLKSLEDRSFDLSKGIVVLDDPVSSLDANALYLAFSVIHERTNRASQLFILTHNFTFFREVRDWFKQLNRKNKKQRPARFFMLECFLCQGQRHATIRPLDPLLEKYRSEYHYLFGRIYSEARACEDGLERDYVLPNMARRLLEAFLAFRQPHVSDPNLWEQLKAIPFDKAKKNRIYRFVQVYSHSGGIGEPEHDLSLLGEARSVLADLLDLMRSVDPDHFEGMERAVKEAYDGTHASAP